MSRKTVKDLDGELSLIRKLLEELKLKFDILASKYEHLEEKCGEGKSNFFKCDKCDEEFSRKKDLQKHKRKHMSCLPGVFRCDECDSTFNEEWKREAHKKNHGTNKCDQCDKKFKFKVNLKKHMQASHGTVKLYCHYYNNDDECPFDSECIFAHEDADICKYGEACERINCMYKHEDKINDSEDDDSEDDDNEEDENKDDDNDVTDESDEENGENKGNDEDIVDGEKIFRCNLCVFETKEKAKLEKHKFEKIQCKFSQIQTNLARQGAK